MSLTRRRQGTTLRLALSQFLIKKKGPPVSLGELFPSIRERLRRSARQPYEEGAQIRKRLQELLAVPTPTQEVVTPFTNARIEKEVTVLPTHGLR